ncbi:MAG: hypothetical protein QXV32_08785 [Conexivisphaerales archaeon]
MKISMLKWLTLSSYFFLLSVASLILIYEKNQIGLLAAAVSAFVYFAAIRMKNSGVSGFSWFLLGAIGSLAFASRPYSLYSISLFTTLCMASALVELGLISLTKGIAYLTDVQAREFEGIGRYIAISSITAVVVAATVSFLTISTTAGTLTMNNPVVAVLLFSLIIFVTFILASSDHFAHAVRSSSS